MYLRSLEVHHFKNHVSFHLEAGQGIHCIIGSNGSGKTSLLDAIYYLGFTKSYFHIPDRHLICHGADFFNIKGSFYTDSGLRDVQCFQPLEGKKQCIFNEKKITRLADHVGTLPMVMVVPRDIELLYGGSDERRRFMDLILIQTAPGYIYHLQRYQKALELCNRMLKEANPHAPEPMQWNAYRTILAEEGQVIQKHRLQLMEDFLPHFKNSLQHISLDSDLTELRYITQDLQGEKYIQSLIQSAEKDIIMGRTMCGIHRDSMAIELNGHDLKNEGSQGQQKSCIIAMKLAMYSYIHEKTGLFPILMLDDLFEKLDENRAERLVKWVDEMAKGQIFLTDTHVDRCKKALQGVSHPVIEIYLR